jgi:ceramide glucosyltransferase
MPRAPKSLLGSSYSVIFSPHAWMSWCGTALAAAVATYTVVAAYAVRTRLKPHPLGSLSRKAAPVTILKPLCGAEHELYECLRSFCDQEYPRFQIVFGVSDPDDPAIGVVARLAREFPKIDIQLAVDRRQHGTSRKVSNLINMMPFARHELLVISDSDVRVDRDYLARIVAPLADPGVGIVTCPYLGRPRKGFWSLLGSLFINDWFTPSVRVAAMFGSRAFAFGATISIRRQVLRRIGGFASIANQLADDYRLGELTRGLGLRTVLSDVVVETCVDEPTLSELVHHELRWLRTIRIVRPVGYTLSVVTFGVPVAAAGCLLAGCALPAITLLAVTALARIMLHLRVRGTDFPSAHQLMMLPIRDMLSLALWIWGFATRRVQWRDDSFEVARDGSADPVVRDAA